MEILEAKRGPVAVLMFKGRLDPHTTPTAHRQLFRCIDRGEKNIVADLSELEYASSAGLCLFMLAARRLKASQGKLVFCCTSPAIQEIFDIAGFRELFSTYPGQEEALASFASPT